MQTRSALVLGMVASLSLAPSAEASLSGRWRGTGHSVESSGKTGECRTIEFDIQHEPTTFTLQLGRVLCTNIRTNWRPVTLAIENGELKRNGVVVGKISETTLVAEVVVQALGVRQRLTLEVEPTGLHYVEKWFDLSTGEIKMMIESHLLGLQP